MTWVGSQATKVLRLGLAVGMAPAVDAGLTWLERALRLRGRGQALATAVAGCVGVALVLFAGVVALWS